MVTMGKLYGVKIRIDTKQKYIFGMMGIWHMPASENTKARDIKAVVLEQVKGGLLYIFTLEPTVKGAKNLTYRTATIFPSDFELIDQDWCPACSADLPENHFLKR